MNPLTEIIPSPARKYVYAAVFVAGLILTGLQASEGDWLAFATYLVPTLSSAMAASNTNKASSEVDPGDTVDGHDATPFLD